MFTGQENYTGQEKCTGQGITEQTELSDIGQKPDIAIIGAAAYNLLAKKTENHLFSASIKDIKKALKPK